MHTDRIESDRWLLSVHTYLERLSLRVTSAPHLQCVKTKDIPSVQDWLYEGLSLNTQKCYTNMFTMNILSANVSNEHITSV